MSGVAGWRWRGKGGKGEGVAVRRLRGSLFKQFKVRERVRSQLLTRMKKLDEIHRER